MRSSIVLLSFLFSGLFSVLGQNKNDLTIHYLNEYPYAFEENDKLKGIEIDILYHFQSWLKSEKQMDVSFTYVEETSFDDAYKATLKSENSVTAASVTITKERKADVDFSKPYLKNASVLVTGMSVQSLRTYNELPTVFEGKVALVRKGTTHEEELKEIKAMYFPGMIVKYVETIDEMEEMLNKDEKYFAIIDLITFWRWKMRDEMPIKMHNVMTERNEKFGFAFSKGSGMAELFNEFFMSGFKFTSTEEYVSILDMYLGPEIRESVRMK